MKYGRTTDDILYIAKSQFYLSLNIKVPYKYVSISIFLWTYELKSICYLGYGIHCLFGYSALDIKK